MEYPVSDPVVRNRLLDAPLWHLSFWKPPSRTQFGRFWNAMQMSLSHRYGVKRSLLNKKPLVRMPVEQLQRTVKLGSIEPDSLLGEAGQRRREEVFKVVARVLDDIAIDGTSRAWSTDIPPNLSRSKVLSWFQREIGGTQYSPSVSDLQIPQELAGSLVIECERFQTSAGIGYLALVYVAEREGARFPTRWTRGQHGKRDYLSATVAVPDVDFIGFVGVPLPMEIEHLLGNLQIVDGMPRMATGTHQTGRVIS